MTLVASVVTYNSARTIGRCTRGLTDSREVDRIVVVDSGSDESEYQATLTTLRADFNELGTQEPTRPAIVSSCLRFANGRLLFVRLRDNIGYGSANNVGFAMAGPLQDVDFFWVLNPDTAIQPGAAGALLESAKANPEAGVWGCMLLGREDPLIIESAGGVRFPWWAIRRRPVGGGGSAAQLPSEFSRTIARARFDYVAGATMFFSAGVFREVAGFDERFFLYYEDFDICREVVRRGYSLGFEPRAVVVHEGGVSSGGRSVTSSMRSETSEFNTQLSFLRFQQKWRPRVWVLLAVPRTLAKLAALAVGGDRRLVAAVIRATATGVLRLPDSTDLEP